MDIKQLLLNGEDVLKDGISGIYYINIDRRRIRTTSENRDLQANHGRRTSPVYARNRIITIEWYVDGIGNAEQEAAVRYLERIFSLQSDTSNLQTKLLQAKDMFDEERTLETIVVDPITIVEASEDMPGAAYRRRVVLESASTPIFRSLYATQILGASSSPGGFVFPFVFPFSFSGYDNLIEVTTTGNSSTPVDITLTATETVLGDIFIINMDTGKYIQVDTDLATGDVLVIKSSDYTITLNGDSIITDRVAGSTRLTTIGTDTYAIYSPTSTPGAMDVEINFNNYYL